MKKLIAIVLSVPVLFTAQADDECTMLCVKDGYVISTKIFDQISQLLGTLKTQYHQESGQTGDQFRAECESQGGKAEGNCGALNSTSTGHKIGDFTQKAGGFLLDTATDTLNIAKGVAKDTIDIAKNNVNKVTGWVKSKLFG